MCKGWEDGINLTMQYSTSLTMKVVLKLILKMILKLIKVFLLTPCVDEILYW